MASQGHTVLITAHWLSTFRTALQWPPQGSATFSRAATLPASFQEATSAWLADESGRKARQPNTWQEDAMIHSVEATGWLEHQLSPIQFSTGLSQWESSVLWRHPGVSREACLLERADFSRTVVNPERLAFSTSPAPAAFGPSGSRHLTAGKQRVTQRGKTWAAWILCPHFQNWKTVVNESFRCPCQVHYIWKR